MGGGGCGETHPSERFRRPLMIQGGSAGGYLEQQRAHSRVREYLGILLPIAVCFKERLTCRFSVPTPGQDFDQRLGDTGKS